MRVNPGKILNWMFPDVVWQMDDPSGIYLTFDDGPTPGVTEWILQTLDRYDAKATFFVLGKNVELYPDLYRMILDRGHKVGNHTYSHQKGLTMSTERYIEDVDLAADMVHSELFRPPYARIYRPRSACEVPYAGCEAATSYRCTTAPSRSAIRAMCYPHCCAQRARRVSSVKF